MTPEEKAGPQIDAMLTASGWVFQDYKAYNRSAARDTALREAPLAVGRCYYLLVVDRQPVGVTETKKKDTTLSVIAEQSGRSGANLPDFLKTATPLPFYYESTGVETFFQDERDPEPRSLRVFGFHRAETQEQTGTVFWAKDLDSGFLPDSTHVELPELLAALSPLNELLKDLDRIAGFKTAGVTVIEHDLMK